MLGLGTGLGGSEGTGGVGTGCSLRQEGLLLDRVFVLMKLELSVLYLVISLSVSYIRRLCLTQGREELLLYRLLRLLSLPLSLSGPCPISHGLCVRREEGSLHS